MADISFEDFFKKTDNIYEAVVAMSRRARQVTDEQKRQLEKEMELNPLSESRDAADDFDEIEIDREALKREITKYPKPTTVAMEEMAEGNINYGFREPEPDTADTNETK